MNQLLSGEIIDKTAEYVKSKQIGEGSGHDWWHTYRVWQNAKKIIENYPQADSLIVELSALLHDIADWKFHDGDELIGARTAENFLKTLQVDENTITHVYSIISKLSFKGANVVNEIDSLEGEIVQDADRLDAIGAIGVARAFAYGGKFDREFYNPEEKPQLHDSAQAYRNSNSTTINHFYEKLLLLKDRFNTQEGKKLALKRHEFMLQFLDEFFEETSQNPPIL